MADTENVGKIYKLYTPDNSLVYYGSTKNDLRKRLSEHKSNWKLHKAGKSKRISTSSQLFETSLFIDIVLVETVIGNREVIHARERFHIENNDCVNKCIPGRTPKDYYLENKDKILAYSKDYREQNKEQISAYREQNKEQISAYNKDYYQKSKIQIPGE
jgi:hypothetical protein